MSQFSLVKKVFSIQKGCSTYFIWDYLFQKLNYKPLRGEAGVTKCENGIIVGEKRA